MSWVVDTCLIIDVLDNDPSFGTDSAQLIDKYAKEDLSLCPISYIELAPAFLGDRRRQDNFLSAKPVRLQIKPTTFYGRAKRTCSSVSLVHKPSSSRAEQMPYLFKLRSFSVGKLCITSH